MGESKEQIKKQVMGEWSPLRGVGEKKFLFRFHDWREYSLENERIAIEKKILWNLAELKLLLHNLFAERNSFAVLVGVREQSGEFSPKNFLP